MEQQLTDIVLRLGFPGVVIVILAFAYRAKDKKVDEVNEKRVAESRESIKAMEQSTGALETLTEVLRERNK